MDRLAFIVSAIALNLGSLDSWAGEDGTPTLHGGQAGAHPPNQLAAETSPYLLMHAHNPVDWHSWGPKALEKARTEDKLIFLSIGYSSCYWCHVMERESFMDKEIAAKLNEHFVSIKVDREERPDIDEIYMTALHVYFRLVRSPAGGGWPLSMFLTPEGKPIMGGTYFPPRDKEGFTGFLTLLERLHTAWEQDPEALRRAAQQVAAIVRRQLENQPPPDSVPGMEHLREVLAELARQHDPDYGGFGYSVVNPRMPKFPEPSNLTFLLNQARRNREIEDGEINAESMLVATLENMAVGGIRDHVGGGFHRYSTDRYWHIPHFEKMLYDNGQLASVYAEAYELTGREDFRRVVEETLEFVLREMTSPEGAFYSALDAETDEEEGAFYAWEAEELQRVSGEDSFGLLAEVYGVDDAANFEGRHVLLIRTSFEETADSRGIDLGDLQRRLTSIRERLLSVRQKRPRPLTDTKVLTAWNGLMIRGFADAGRILDDPMHVASAKTAAEFVLGELRTDDGRLLRTFGEGQAKLNAYLDDYAFLIDGLLALEKATGERRWLEEADGLTNKQIELFWDEKQGGFFFTSSDHETLLARSKDPADSVLPSGNAVSVENLTYLAGALEKPEYLELAEKTLGAFGPLMKQMPAAMPRMAVALDRYWEARK